MKKAIGIVLLTLMCIQLLPIKEMGRLLFNNQIVEEHPVDNADSGDFTKLFKELKFLNLHDNAVLFQPAFFYTIAHYNYFEEIPQNPAREIHCPPPNC
jgi:hypothetical protein